MYIYIYLKNNIVNPKRMERLQLSILEYDLTVSILFCVAIDPHHFPRK